MVDLKIVPLEPSQSPEQRVAEACKILYLAFREVGFTDTQAFELMRDHTWDAPDISPPDETA